MAPPQGAPRGEETGFGGVDRQTYDVLAPIYDEWQERYGAFWKLVLPKLEATLAEHRWPDPSFLELGCGTGSLLLGLRRTDPQRRLCGLDASGGLLGVARGKPRAQSIRWIQGGFETATGERPFGAAGAFFDTLNHAVAPGALEQALQTLGRALVPNGLLVFDLNNESGFSTWWRNRRVFVVPRGTLTVEASFDPASGIAQGRATVHLRDSASSSSMEVLERCFSEAQVRGALLDQGFSVEAAEPWSPFPDDVPGKTWWVARRL